VLLDSKFGIYLGMNGKWDVKNGPHIIFILCL